MKPQHTLHPWHGINIGEHAPEIVTSFIEIVPTDTIKYEIDKESGWLKVDRPQKFSNIVPSLYGFIPQTYCGKNVAQLATKFSGKLILEGDKDPLDICVLSSKNISRGGIILQAIPIGGFCLIDNNEADDKIIAVLKGDDVYEIWKDINDVPVSLINRLKHYFLTYKNMPGEKKIVEITELYNRLHAYEVIKTAQKDYQIF
ncbi:MAG: inorganic pyrophosphatase [Ignavibacteria bacterium]|nr:inorganic pyrophosphatase [Ignavibacteria bacterium]